MKYKSIRDKLNQIIAERILILDGAMGSMLQAYRSSGCNDQLCLTKPDIISSIHEAYLEAGADIIETCSFNATPISLRELNHQNLTEDSAREISAAAASLARKAADKFSTPQKPCFVAGSMGPTGKSLSFTPDLDNPSIRQISWEEMEGAYYENARGLIEGGADILLIETVFDSLNAKAAFSAIKQLSKELGQDLPVMVSATVSETGHLLTGQTIEAFCVAMLEYEPLAIGLNCSFGPDLLKGPLERLSSYASCPVIFYPNAGLPDSHGHYLDTPQTMALAAETCMQAGHVNIIGGCCGSTPDHIAALAEKARNHKPRSIPSPHTKTLLSGTQVLEIDDLDSFIKTQAKEHPWQAAGQASMQTTLDQGNYEDAIDIARDMAEKGLKILKINPDKSPQPLKTLESFIFMSAGFSDLAKLPILIESSSMDIIDKGLKIFQGKGLSNHINP